MSNLRHPPGKGASAFVDFSPQGVIFAATVEQRGRQFTAIVNPDTGTVTRQN